MTNKELITQYATTGATLTHYQLENLNSGNRRSYLRTRIIQVEEYKEELHDYEAQYLEGENLKKYVTTNQYATIPASAYQMLEQEVLAPYIEKKMVNTLRCFRGGGCRGSFEDYEYEHLPEEKINELVVEALARNRDKLPRTILPRISEKLQLQYLLKFPESWNFDMCSEKVQETVARHILKNFPLQVRRHMIKFFSEEEIEKIVDPTNKFQWQLDGDPRFNKIYIRKHIESNRFLPVQFFRSMPVKAQLKFLRVMRGLKMNDVRMGLDSDTLENLDYIINKIESETGSIPLSTYMQYNQLLGNPSRY